MSHTVKPHLDWLAVVLLTVLCLSWGLQQIAIKLAAADVSLVMQSAIRSIGATILVAAWMALRREPIFARDGTLWWGIGAGLLFGSEFLLLYWGLEFTHASRAVVFLYLAPFVVALGVHLLIPGEKLVRIQVIGLFLAFAGILAAFGESFTFPSAEMLIGDAMLIAAAVLWGATTVLIKVSPLPTISPAKTLLYQLAVSAILLLLGSLALGEAGIVRWSTVAILSLIYQTVWVAAITYQVWFWLIRHYPAARLSAFSFLTPLFGVLAGGFFLDEPLTLVLLLALVLVGTGIYLVNRRNGR